MVGTDFMQLNPWSILGWGVIATIILYAVIETTARFLRLIVPFAAYLLCRRTSPAVGQVWVAGHIEWEITDLHAHHFTMTAVTGRATHISPMPYDSFQSWKRRHWSYLTKGHSVSQEPLKFQI